MSAALKPLKAPFPYFGGKSKIAPVVWDALGDVDTYIEPFFGSGAVMLGRPHAARTENINDADGLLANFWRAIAADPDAVAHHADWPCNEADLHARHLWLVGQRESLTTRLMGDDAFYDVKAAGWWVWGLCNWIGRGWCSGKGPWFSLDGELVDRRKLADPPDAGQGINRQMPHMSAGQGINRQMPHMGDAGRGINRKMPHMGNAGRGAFIADWFTALSERFRGTRVACGDWKRVCGPSVRRAGGPICGVFLDPPYDLAMRAAVYSVETPTARECLDWCLEHGDEPGLRIVLAGYDGEHNALESVGWRAVAWKAPGGYANQGDARGKDNAKKERLWLSPGCLGTDRITLV